MAKNDDRFEVVSTEGGWSGHTHTILMDTVTGVQYLFVQSGSAGGLCPILDKDGKPMAWYV